MNPTESEWRNALEAHLRRLRGRGYSARTIAGQSDRLHHAIACLVERGIAGPDAVTLADLEAYSAALAQGRRCPATCRNHLTTLRVFFRELRRVGVLTRDPAEQLVLPPPSHALPRTILSAAEIARLRVAAYTTGRNRTRNRAVVEVLYATGVRRAECAALTISDVDFQRQTLFVRLGKGRRQRVLPIASRALRWIAAYLKREQRSARRELAGAAPLFAGRAGRALSPSHLTDLVRVLMARACIDRPGACHALRHSMATHMLDNGADIRFIQAMLGHACISTTMVYTQVSIRTLAEVYRRTHPAACEDGGETPLGLSRSRPRS